MGTVYNCNVVTDGLRFIIDPANRKSYPGVGAEIVNLAGSQNGAIFSGPTFDSDNMGILSFDGTDDEVHFASDTVEGIALGAYSVSAWARWTYTSGTFKAFIAFGANTAGGFALGSSYAAAGADEVSLGRYTGTSGAAGYGRTLADWDLGEEGTGLNDGVWHYVVATRDTAGTSTVLYVDGEAITIRSVGSLYMSVYNIIGTNYYGAYIGDLGAVLIYDRVLSAEDVLQNYNATKPRFTPRVALEGLVANWDAGDPRSYAGGTTWKSLVEDHEGALTNGPTFSAVGGGSILFDGTDDYVGCGTGTDILASSPFTTTVWFKWVTEQAGFIMSCNGPSMSMWYDGSTNIYVGGSAVDNAPYFAWTFDTEWHHIAAVDEGSGIARVYLDGLLQSLTSSGSLNSQTAFLIGGRLDYHKFEGNIATVRVYNHAFSADRVLQNYNALKGRFA